MTEWRKHEVKVDQVSPLSVAFPIIDMRTP